MLMFPQFKATAQGFYSNRCLFHRKRQCSTLTFKISITKMKTYSMALCSETSVTPLRASKSTLRNKCLSVLTSVSTTFLTSMTLLRRRKRWKTACLTIGSMSWTSHRWNHASNAFATTLHSSMNRSLMNKRKNMAKRMNYLFKDSLQASLKTWAAVWQGSRDSTPWNVLKMRSRKMKKTKFLKSLVRSSNSCCLWLTRCRTCTTICERDKALWSM